VSIWQQSKTEEVIVSLDTADVFAQLKGAEANLLAEQARLVELRKGLRPEEISVEDSKLKTAQVTYDASRVGIINAFHDAYTKTNSALLNYADTLFINPQNIRPQLRIRSNQEESISNNRVLLGER
jgi:multidrug resistance efflux pump